MDAPIRPPTHYGFLDEIHSSLSSLKAYDLETLTSDDKLGYQGKLADGNVTFHISGKGVIDFSKYSSGLSYASQVFSRFGGRQSTDDTVKFLDSFKNYYLAKSNAFKQILSDLPLDNQEIKELAEKISAVRDSLEFFHRLNLTINDFSLPLNDTLIDLNLTHSALAVSLRKKTSLENASNVLQDEVTNKLNEIAEAIFIHHVKFHTSNTQLKFENLTIINEDFDPHFFLNLLDKINYTGITPSLDITHSEEIKAK